jgi:glycerol kinase
MTACRIKKFQSSFGQRGHYTCIQVAPVLLLMLMLLIRAEAPLQMFHACHVTDSGGCRSCCNRLQVYTAGGGAKNAKWMAMRAAKLGVPVEASPQAEAAYGAALLARQGWRQWEGRQAS